MQHGSGGGRTETGRRGGKTGRIAGKFPEVAYWQGEGAEWQGETQARHFAGFIWACGTGRVDR